MHIENRFASGAIVLHYYYNPKFGNHTFHRVNTSSDSEVEVAVYFSSLVLVDQGMNRALVYAPIVLT